MITAVVVGALLVLAVAVALGDGACARLAERKAAQYLAGPFGRPPAVRLHGRPFLAQAIRGRYRDIEIRGDGLQIGEISGATLSAHLYGAVLPARELLGGRSTALPCDRVAGQTVLPYGELARITRLPGLTLHYDEHRLVATLAVPVPGVGQLARASGQARLSVIDGVVRLRVQGFSVAGISLPGAVLKQLVPSLNVPVPLPALPYGLCLDGLTPTAAGLVVRVSAGATVFVRPI